MKNIQNRKAFADEIMKIYTTSSFGNFDSKKREFILEAIRDTEQGNFLAVPKEAFPSIAFNAKTPQIVLDCLSQVSGLHPAVQTLILLNPNVMSATAKRIMQVMPPYKTAQLLADLALKYNDESEALYIGAPLPQATLGAMLSSEEVMKWCHEEKLVYASPLTYCCDEMKMWDYIAERGEDLSEHEALCICNNTKIGSGIKNHIFDAYEVDISKIEAPTDYMTTQMLNAFLEAVLLSENEKDRLAASNAICGLIMTGKLSEETELSVVKAIDQYLYDAEISLDLADKTDRSIMIIDNILSTVAGHSKNAKAIDNVQRMGYKYIALAALNPKYPSPSAQSFVVDEAVKWMGRDANEQNHLLDYSFCSMAIARLINEGRLFRDEALKIINAPACVNRDGLIGNMVSSLNSLPSTLENIMDDERCRKTEWPSPSHKLTYAKLATLNREIKKQLVEYEEDRYRRPLPSYNTDNSENSKQAFNNLMRFFYSYKKTDLENAFLFPHEWKMFERAMKLSGMKDELAYFDHLKKSVNMFDRFISSGGEKIASYSRAKFTGIESRDFITGAVIDIKKTDQHDVPMRMEYTPKVDEIARMPYKEFANIYTKLPQDIRQILKSKIIFEATEKFEKISQKELGIFPYSVSSLIYGIPEKYYTAYSFMEDAEKEIGKNFQNDTIDER